MYIKYMWSKDLSSIGVAVQEQLCKNKVDKPQLGIQGTYSQNFSSIRSMVYEELWSKDLSSIGVAVQEQLCKNEVDKAQLGI